MIWLLRSSQKVSSSLNFTHEFGRYRFVLIICLIAFFSFILQSCATGVTNKQIKKKLTEVLNNVDIYCYKMEMNMKTSVIEEDLNEVIKSNVYGCVDAKNKKMKITIDLNEISNKGQIKSTETEIYIFNTIEYIRSGKNHKWIKFKVSKNKLDNENQLKKQMNLTIASKIENLKEGTFKHIDYYLLSIKPEKKAFWKVIMEEEQEHPLLKLLNLNYEDIVKQMNMEVWIEKKRFIPLKCVMQMKAVIEKNIMKKPFTMIINVKKVYNYYYNYNKPLIIKLPTRAKNAPFYYEE